MTRTVLAFVLVAISPLCLCGCDLVYGINSGKLVEDNIDDHCIADALKRTPGVVAVSTRTVLYQGWRIAGPGPNHGSPIRYFTYDIDAEFGPTLMIEDYGDGKYRVSDYMMRMNARIPKAVMDKALPIMRAAERQVSRDCGMEIGAGLKHSCDGSACGDP